MAIRVILESTINCDECKKEIADIKMSKEFYNTVMAEERFIRIICAECKTTKNLNKEV